VTSADVGDAVDTASFLPCPGEPGGEQTVLHPQRRVYNKSPKPNTEVAIHSAFGEDGCVRLAGRKGDRSETAIVQASVNPPVCRIWFGAIVMTSGAGLCLVFSRRKAPRPGGGLLSSGRSVRVEPLPQTLVEMKLLEETFV